MNTIEVIDRAFVLAYIWENMRQTPITALVLVLEYQIGIEGLMVSSTRYRSVLCL